MESADASQLATDGTRSAKRVVHMDIQDIEGIQDIVVGKIVTTDAYLIRYCVLLIPPRKSGSTQCEAHTKGSQP